MDFEVGADLDPSPMPADEYDSYLFEVWNMCRSGKGKADIIEYLGRVESEYIGISRPAGDKALFVDKLRNV